MNTTLNTAGTAYFNKQFYDKKLLETAKTRLVHATFGQKAGSCTSPAFSCSMRSASYSAEDFSAPLLRAWRKV